MQLQHKDRQQRMASRKIILKGDGLIGDFMGSFSECWIRVNNSSCGTFTEKEGKR